jgi:DNA invertase Pin-like site-specific DNA recombinase
MNMEDRTNHAGAVIGYARVSTEEQNSARQEDALEREGCGRVYIDKISGAKASRPELDKLLEYVREGDTVVVTSFSRLSRSTKDLLEIVETLRQKGVALRSLKENLDTDTPQGRFQMQVFAALNEFEREQMLQRQREGIEAARARGKHLGRPKAPLPDNFEEVFAQWRRGEITAAAGWRATGLSKSRWYQIAKERGVSAS